MFGRRNIADLKIKNNFGSGENLLGKRKTFVGQVHFQFTCHGATELNFFWLWSGCIFK